jgi:DNA-binding transcriptional LysR family regulator
MLLREQGSGTRTAFESALAQAGQDLSAFRVVGEMGSTQAIKQAVKAGVGVSVISRRAVDEECRTGLVWCLKIRDLKVTRASTSPLTAIGAARRSRRPSVPSSRRSRPEAPNRRVVSSRPNLMDADARLTDPKTGKQIRLTSYAACAG